MDLLSRESEALDNFAISLQAKHGTSVIEP